MNARSDRPSSALQSRAHQEFDLVCAALRMEPAGRSRFTGAPVPVQWGVPYGGLLFAQALAAALATTPETMWPRSIHAYFVGAGIDTEPVDLHVTEVRTTRASAWRSVELSQNGVLLLKADALFSKEPADTARDHAASRPEAPDPESLPNVGDQLVPYGGTFTPWTSDSAFDLRYVTPHPRVAAATPDADRAARSLIWMKAARTTVDDPRLLAALLAYASDTCMLDPCLRPSGLWFGEASANGLTLDHSMWFHRPARLDDWLLVDLQSPSMQGGRGLGVADFYARDGELLCSVAQLGTIRPRIPTR